MHPMSTVRPSDDAHCRRIVGWEAPRPEPRSVDVFGCRRQNGWFFALALSAAAARKKRQVIFFFSAPSAVVRHRLAGARTVRAVHSFRSEDRRPDPCGMNGNWIGRFRRGEMIFVAAAKPALLDRSCAPSRSISSASSRVIGFSGRPGRAVGSVATHSGGRIGGCFRAQFTVAGATPACAKAISKMVLNVCPFSTRFSFERRGPHGGRHFANR